LAEKTQAPKTTSALEQRVADLEALVADLLARLKKQGI